MKQSFTFQDLFENRRKMMKMQKESYSSLSGSDLRLQCCLRNLRIACKAVQVAIPLGELELKQKNRGNILTNLFIICEPYTHQVQLYDFQSNLILCDGTFNKLQNVGLENTQSVGAGRRKGKLVYWEQ
jgi:hypothetical protein